MLVNGLEMGGAEPVGKSVAMPCSLGKAGRRAGQWESLWQMPGLHVSLGPGAEPPPAPADLEVPLVNKQPGEETLEAPQLWRKLCK